MISPNGDGVNDTVTFSFTLAQNVPVRVEIVQDGFAVATPFQGQLGVGPHAVDWDGTTNGCRLPDGAYVASSRSPTRSATCSSRCRSRSTRRRRC